MSGAEGSRAEGPEGHRWVVGGVLAFLIAQFVVLGLIQAWEDAFTYDEPYYAASGSTALRERDLRINYEHPPLPKILAAIPAELAGDVEIPMATGAWDRADTLDLSLEMYQANVDHIQRVTFLYRIVPTLLAAGAGLLLFLLGRRLFGWQGGLLAAALWLTAPIALGIGHLNGLDVPAAFTVLLCLWLLARYLDRPSLAGLLMVAASVGVALLTRAGVGFVVAGAAFTVILLADLFRREWLAPLRAMSVLVLAWMMVWAGYWLLDPSGLDLSILDAYSQALWTAPPDSIAGRIALAVPWPVGFEAGIRFLADIHQDAAPGYLLGFSFLGAPPVFWLGSFALKMTLVSMGVIVIGLGAWFAMGRGDLGRALLVLGPMMAGLVVMMAFAERPLGVRVLIPIIVILLAASGAVSRFATRRWVGIGLILVVLIQMGTLWRSHPESLAWSNPLFRESWQLAADSNVDWGQDFYRLQHWAARQDEPVWMSYFGFGPSFELSEVDNAVSADSFPPGRLTTYAVSATHLNSPIGEEFGRLRSYCPVEVIGQTILVYRLEEPPAPLALQGPVEGVPVPSCEGATYSHEVKEHSHPVEQYSHLVAPPPLDDWDRLDATGTIALQRVVDRIEDLGRQLDENPSAETRIPPEVIEGLVAVQPDVISGVRLESGAIVFTTWAGDVDVTLHVDDQSGLIELRFSRFAWLRNHETVRDILSALNSGISQRPGARFEMISVAPDGIVLRARGPSSS